MRAVLRSSALVVVVSAVSVALTAPSSSVAATAPRLAATPTAGQAPLQVAFDTARTTADGTVAEHLLLLGNGDAVTLAAAADTANYGYQLPGFYLAQTWLRDASGGFGASPPVGIAVGRPRDGRDPPAVSVLVAPTTDALTIAFMATVTPVSGDAVVARRWDFGDGERAGEEAPFHAYKRPGVYQAAFVASSRAGLAAFARVLVVVPDPAGGGLPPSLIVAATPEDASVLTPVTVTAFVEGVAPDATVASAEVAWPDFDDAAPVVTPTTAGITVSSQHGFTEPGYYDVPVRVQLKGQTEPLAAVAHVMVAMADGSPPSPVMLMAPSAHAGVDAPYQAGDAGPTARALLVGGIGPFAFGAAAPSPSNFTVDDEGNVTWVPTRAQLGTQRLAVRIVDADGREAMREWVVDVEGHGGGCAFAAAGAPSGAALLVVALALLWAWRRAVARA
jgi:MYXO-CTERM domain-containing protein